MHFFISIFPYFYIFFLLFFHGIHIFHIFSIHIIITFRTKYIQKFSLWQWRYFCFAQKYEAFCFMLKKDKVQNKFYWEYYDFTMNFFYILICECQSIAPIFVCITIKKLFSRCFCWLSFSMFRNKFKIPFFITKTRYLVSLGLNIAILGLNWEETIVWGTKTFLNLWIV